MKEIISCFGEQAVQVADFSSRSSAAAASPRFISRKVSCMSNAGAANASSLQDCSGTRMVSSVYSLMASGCPVFVTVTWGKTVSGNGLVVDVCDYQNRVSENLTKSLWKKKKGCKRLELGASKFDVLWNIGGNSSSSRSKACSSGLHDLSQDFHVTVISAEDGETLLELGDNGSLGNSNSNSNGAMICRKEHISGRGSYCTRAQLFRNGLWHDVSIEYLSERQGLCVFIDKEVALQVKHLRWKFRGNQTICVDGSFVELFWDVHDWFFGQAEGHGVFMFQTFAEDNLHSVSSSKLLRDFSLILHAWMHE